jgi:eukaryotic-like serine/threonine-protein kinase
VATDPAHHARLKQLFDEVCDSADPVARLQDLRLRGVDEALLAELTTLLGHVDQPTHFAAPVATAAVQWLDDELRPGDRLGAWTLTRALGQGGMGRVFLAERSDGHYEQCAAIKLLLGWSGVEALALLKRERQILAGLSHPHIAPLIDGGTTPSGQPYLVMTYVDGLPIDTWCARNQSTLVQRLALFDNVCAAVAYAHRHLVIHCDIKPSNVLVTGEGQAVLLDFGIARLQGQADTASAAMTPGYASPEQQAGQAPGVASDIYSLGRLLEALLQPIAARHRRGAELAAIVAHATAPRPDDRFESVPALQQDLHRLLAHQALQSMPRRAPYLLGKLLRRRWPLALVGAVVAFMAVGFLVRLSLERDRAVAAEQSATRAASAAVQSATRARQAEATALAAEQRARADLSRAEMAEADAVLQRDRARDAERRAAEHRDRALLESRRATMEAATTRETSRFLMSLFTGADPKLTGLPDMPASIDLVKGRQRLTAEMDQDPALRARLQVVVGDVYERIGRRADATAAFADAARAFAVLDTAQPLAEADALRRLALALSNDGRADEAEAPARRALALRERHDAGDRPSLADAENRLGIVLMNLRHFDEARRHLDRALSLRLQTAGADDPNTTSTLHNLARLNHLSGRLDTAEAQFRRALLIKRRTLKPQDQRVLGSLEAHGLVLSDLQRHAEAERRLREATQGWQTVFGPDNKNVAIARHRLGHVLVAAGRMAQARSELSEALRIESRGGDAPTLRASMIRIDQARLFEAVGQLPQAEQAWRAALAQLRGAAPALTVADAETGLAHTLWQMDRADDASAVLAPALATFAARLPAEDTLRLRAQMLAAELALAHGEGARAEALIQDLARQLDRTPPQWQAPGLTLGLLALRGHAQMLAGQPQAASRWLARAWSGQTAWRGAAPPQLLPLGLDLLAALTASGQTAAALALRPALQASAHEHAAASPWRQRLLKELAKP